MKIGVNKLREEIRKLQELGFDFDAELLGDDKNGLVNELKSYSNEVGEIDLWLVIREFGNSCFWFDGKPIVNGRRYSKNTSTIIYDEYFLSNPLSYIFEELKRITDGKFEYKVIKEFGTTENDKEFWKYLDEKRGNDYFVCEYIIGEKPVNIRYDFYKPDWIYLEPNFLTRFVKDNFGYLKSLNINHLEPEEFMTFFCISKESQVLLKNKPSIFINNDLCFEQIQHENNQIDTSANQSQAVKRWWKFWE